MIKRYTALILLVCCCFSINLYAQEELEEDIPRSVNEATLIGAGAYNVKDTYLSPIKYTGWGLRILNERMKTVRLLNSHISRQQSISVDISSTHNPAESLTDFSGFVDYRLGYHYRFKVLPEMKILTGFSGHFMGGFIYNTQNGNNPASAKADIDLNISLIAIYGFSINNYPFTVRYQTEIPFVGFMFSPHYEQSYYEIFNQGNTSGVFPFNSFHNKFAFQNYITVDFPLYNCTVRAGYLNSAYRTDVNHIKSHVISHSFMIGLVKEFISFGGKRLKQTHKFNSSYY